MNDSSLEEVRANSQLGIFIFRGRFLQSMHSLLEKSLITGAIQSYKLIEIKCFSLIKIKIMVLKRAFGYLFVNKSDIQSLVFVEQDA